VLLAWINRRAIKSLLAVKGEEIVGCGTVVRDPYSRSSHVGEIRMAVSLDVRGQGGCCCERPLRWRGGRGITNESAVGRSTN
jgi:hypothetical protein